jgi:mRNA interferase MazF
MSGRGMPRRSLPKNELAQGAIVLIDFSFSDLKRSKYRPALVISNSSYNSRSLDIVVVRITSRPKIEWAIKITNEDVESGFLEVESYVKVDSIYTVEKTMVVKVVAQLNAEKLCTVKLKLMELFDSVK